MKTTITIKKTRKISPQPENHSEFVHSQKDWRNTPPLKLKKR